jgi:hypothetical protein
MYNRERTHATIRLPRQVTTGNTVDREGVCVVGVLEDGIEKCEKSDGTAQKFIGFAGLDDQAYATEPRVEDVVIPSSAPYEVQLSSTNEVGSVGAKEARVYNVTDSDEMTTQGKGAGDVDTNEKGAIVSGLLTVHSDHAGDTVRVFWRVNLTVLEATSKFWETSPNNQASAIFNEISVLTGTGEMFTYEYDAAVDWSGAVVPSAGADGKVVDGGSGDAIGDVVHVPTADRPFLGIAFSVPRPA